MRQQRGVALILVLMVTGVLALLLLQIGLTAREHTARAQRLLERADADFKLRSINAELMFAMATESWGVDPNRPPQGPYAQNWNFRGQPFTVNAATIVLQDLAGLIPLPQPGSGAAGLALILKNVGVPIDRARAAAAALERVQAPPDFIPLQDLHELSLISDLTPEEISRLRQLATLYPTMTFNPATAPAVSLAVRFSGSALQGLEALRERGELDEPGFFSVTGLGGDEFVSFFPGPGFRITTRVSLGVSEAAEELTLTVDPYATDPFVVWSRRRPSMESAAP